MKKAKRKSKTRDNKPAQKQRLPLKLVPLSVYRGTETLEAYSMRKVAVEKERRAKDQAKQERFRMSCERGRKLLTNPKIKAYWLNQMKGPMSGPIKYRIGIRYEWPKDKKIIYAIMALCIDRSSAIKIIPESLRQTEQFKINKRIPLWIMGSDSLVEFMDYIGSDPQIKRILSDPDKPSTENSNKSSVIQREVGQGNEVPEQPPEVTTLVDFMRNYCELKGEDIDSKKQLMYKQNLNGPISLPETAIEWQSGKTKVFYVKDLIANWPEYRKNMPTLPSLKAQKSDT